MFPGGTACSLSLQSVSACCPGRPGPYFMQDLSDACLSLPIPVPTRRHNDVNRDGVATHAETSFPRARVTPIGPLRRQRGTGSAHEHRHDPEMSPECPRKDTDYPWCS